jgi:hypothetical protein
MNRRLRNYALYAVAAYGVAALWTSGVFVLPMVGGVLSAKLLGEAAYYSIVWPPLWWMIADKGGWRELLPFVLAGAIRTAPLLLLIAAVIWRVRRKRRSIEHRDDGRPG